MPISVPKSFMQHLKEALDALNTYMREHPAQVWGANQMYDYVKNYLKARGVPAKEHRDTSTVPDDHVHWVPK